MPNSVTTIERLARMEVEVKELKSAFQEHKDVTEKKFDEVNQKLDSLLALRNKGAGIVWLVSGLAGTGILTGLIELFHQLPGVK
jgi:ferritin-like metal-binding protein YciE